MQKHLWEVDHDYYCHAFETEEYGSWADYVADIASDMDLNLVVRWDWRQNVDDDGAPVGPAGTGTLRLHFVLQRKGRLSAVAIAVTAEDEAAVREYLAPRLEHLQKLWAPLTERPMSFCDALRHCAATGDALRPAEMPRGFFFTISPRPGARANIEEAEVTLADAKLCSVTGEPATLDVADYLGAWVVLPIRDARAEAFTVFADGGDPV